MKKLKCLIVDDEPLAIALLKDHISKTHFLDVEYATTDPLEALAQIQKKNFDLLFLDIQMPELNGMDLLKIINNKMRVILTTAYSEFALESYEYGVLDYLLKPITFERFYKSVLKILPDPEIKSDTITGKTEISEFMFIKVDGQQIKIFFKELLLIESLRDYVNFKTVDKEYIVLQNLKDVIELLPDHFMRIHRSYIINLDKIIAVSGNQIIINSQNIPVGETYRKNLQTWMKIN